MKEEMLLRAEAVDVCRRLEARGLVAAMDGNVSCRVGETSILVTPSGKPKGELRPFDLLLVDHHGRVLAGEGKPSSELRMHLLVYRERPDVSAIVHAHPSMLTAMTLAGIPFLSDALPEVRLTIGHVPTAPYATPTTDEVPASIAPFVKGHQAILLERHGSLTLGKTMKEACYRLEKLEHAAHTLYYAGLLLGKVPSALPPEALERLDELVY
jgi:L-fuculose-phosphate aldolase